MRQSLVVAALLAAAFPWPANAQRVLSLGLGGGVSIPQGSLADGASTGWHALGAVVLNTPMQPLGLRVDVAYSRFAFDGPALLPERTSGYHSLGSVTANATYRLPMAGRPVSPYLISGLGAYRSDCSATEGCGATTRYGWNVGLGTKLYAFRVRSFLEARYHQTARGQRTIRHFPVTVGLTL